ncbi:GCN5-related N-acetyltransferase 7, chloroplastic-like protein, partial [Drosera capensis]
SHPHPFPTRATTLTPLTKNPTLTRRRPLSISLPVKSRPRVSEVCGEEKVVRVDRSKLVVKEAESDEEIIAAVWLRVRVRVREFNNFREDSFGIQDHKKYLAEIEFKALKERVAGETKGFKKVSCINASLPIAELTSFADHDLCSKCKYLDEGEERFVVGTLDLNQCLRLPNEIIGQKPQGIGSDFLRAYLSSICVAEELQRNGLGHALISKSKAVAEKWGIIHLYVHVAVDNEPAKRLYLKSGFVHESDVSFADAKFLGRPLRILLWFGLPNPHNLQVTV